MSINILAYQIFDPKELEDTMRYYLKSYSPLEDLEYFENDFNMGVEWAQIQLLPILEEFGKFIQDRASKITDMDVVIKTFLDSTYNVKSDTRE